MTRATHLNRASALSAIAAALALSSTPIRAQEVQPVPADPPAAAQPAPTVAEPAPVATEVTPSVDTSSPPAVSETTTTTTTVKHAKPVVAKSIATRSVARTVKTAPAAAPTTATQTSTTSTTTVAPSQAKVAPVVDLNTAPAAPVKTAAAKPADQSNELLPIAGGALALLAVGGAAIAITRRRREHEEEWQDQPIEHESIQPAAVEPARWQEEEQPAIVAPSAFAWEHKPQAAAEPAVRTSDESHVERAYRGPTPENPSLSLRARLKRAAFMDKREREAAAGLAEPVDLTAGLPDRLVEQQESEGVPA